MGYRMSFFFCLILFFSVVLSSTDSNSPQSSPNNSPANNSRSINSTSSNSTSTHLRKFDVTPFLPLFHGKVLRLGGFMNIYKNNTIERVNDNKIVPPSFDRATGVTSKDIVISPENGISARLYIPVHRPEEKHPLLIYVHGGGFIARSATSTEYHNYVNLLSGNANALALSINYRRAPEHPLPVAYQDVWSVVRWVAKHSKGGGSEEWLNTYVDFTKVYLVGDGTGGNIAHNVAMWAGKDQLDGFKLAGMVLLSPFFWGKEPIGEHEPKDLQIRTRIKLLWYVATDMIVGLDDPWINPLKDPNLSKLGCPRVLVCISENERMRDRGEYYYKALKASGWEGEVELHETEAESHAYQLSEPDSHNSQDLLIKVSSFINNKPVPS